jgi:hypothetical protein
MDIAANGDLVLHTSIGDVHQHKPLAYQDIRGARKIVAADYALNADNGVEFKLGEYDRNEALAIDPILVYSTYLGGDETMGNIRAVVAVSMTPLLRPSSVPLPHDRNSKVRGDALSSNEYARGPEATACRA